MTELTKSLDRDKNFQSQANWLHTDYTHPLTCRPKFTTHTDFYYVIPHVGVSFKLVVAYYDGSVVENGIGET